MKNYLEYISESKTSQDVYITESELSLEERWFRLILNGNIEHVQLLLDRGIDINIRDEENITGLISAVACDHIDIVELLLSHPKIDVNAQDEKGLYALFYAALNIVEFYDNSKNILKMLLEHPNINVNLKDNDNDNFMIYIDFRNFLIDDDMQNTILKNKRDDIILFLDKFNLVHPNIKKEYPLLFKTKDWGLI